jgi:hypothetical protein
MRLAAHRLAVAVPLGWEARIFRRVADHPREGTHPVIHLANFPLPEDRGDFGAGVTDRMAGADVFVAVFEYGPESVGQPLFAQQGVPTLTPAMFSPARLQRTIPGQLGAQRFFTAGGRAFCVYAVVAHRRYLTAAVAEVNRALAALEIEPDPRDARS